MKRLLVVGFVVVCVAAQGDTNRFTMPLRGVPLPVEKFKLVNHIPAERLAQLPKRLPIYRYSGRPREFPVPALQMLIDQTAFKGTNITRLLSERANQPGAANGLRLVSHDRLDYIIANPGEGRVIVQSGERARRVPPSDAVPSFEDIKVRLLRLASAFGITTNEMERQFGGDFFVRERGTETSSFGGALKYQKGREVEICRAIPDYPFNSINDDRIALDLGVDGRLRKFDLTWPLIEPVATNRLLSISKLVKAIKQGRVLSDMLNDYPEGGIAEIELKDIRIEYYIPGQPLPLAEALKTDIVPIASILAAFKPKNGEAIEAGLYAPILESAQ